MPKTWSYRGAVRTFFVTRRPCCLAPFGIVGCPSLPHSKPRLVYRGVDKSKHFNRFWPSTFRRDVAGAKQFTRIHSWSIHEDSRTPNIGAGGSRCNTEVWQWSVAKKHPLFGSFEGRKKTCMEFASNGSGSLVLLNGIRTKPLPVLPSAVEDLVNC